MAMTRESLRAGRCISPVFVASNEKERTMRYNKMARLVIGLAAAVLVAACSSGADDPTAAPTVAPAPATTAPSVAPAASSVTRAAPDGLFTGRVHCRGIDTPSGGDPDALYYTCYQVATDPRMAGTIDLVVWLSDNADTPSGPSFTAWGSSTLTNDEGSWVCKEAGMGVWENITYSRDLACVGKGEYVGLSAWLHEVTSNAASDWGFLGWIAKT
jgi:hypothetical protein